MKLGFYAASSLPVEENSIEERPLGGTETGLVRVAEILARAGHEVYVFTSHKSPKTSNQPGLPRYVHFSHAPKFQPFDVLIYVQDWKPAFYGFKARRTLYWTGDGYEQYSGYGLGDLRVQRKFDLLLTVSRWHLESLCDASGFPKEKAVVVGNGIYLPYFSGEEPRNRKRLIYTSAPYRGLELAAAMFVELKKMIPDLEFHVFAGLQIYDTDRPFEGSHQTEYQKLSQGLQRVPGIVLHGNILQRALAREYMRSGLFFYPNTINETCCITALEAQAAGCPAIASAISALPETIGDGGIVIGSSPGSPEYMRDFIAASAKILTDTALWEELSKRASARIRAQFLWMHVAQRFEQIITALN